MKIEIEDLVKQYEEVVALNHVNITLENGIYGLLGPNGAGKSTLMNLLSLLLKQDHGRILFNGKDITEEGNRYLSHVGYMPQTCCLYEDFSFEENMYYIASLKGMAKKGTKEEIERIAKQVGLFDVFHKKVKTFSGGMKQRAMFAQTLLHNPDILILDEPTAGLDPQKRIELRNLIASLSRKRIVLIATHVVHDVEFIANKIILMRKGKILDCDSPCALMSQLHHKVYEVAMQEQDVIAYQQNHLISNLHYVGDTLYAKIIKKEDEEITGQSQYIEPDLNDVYLYYFGNDHDSV